MSNDNTTCEGCGSILEVKFCEGCNDYYCNKCWPSRRAHRENKVGPSGIPHGQLDPRIVEKVNNWMAEPQDADDERRKHDLDEDTIWFGLSKNEDGEPVLAEYRRFAAIMMENPEALGQPRYPSLVSFVGQTGSGKSTLIRLLTNAGNHESPDEHSSPLATPVIGRSDCEVPTSADVHLYSDPTTIHSSRPILFADCEGFEGGERNPVAYAGLESGSGTHHLRQGLTRTNPVSRIVHFTQRALLWASRNALGYETTGKRQYAVAEMYPRIFHVFSDVVVFVLNNPKTMEDVVEKLLSWADSNYSASINLPSKPHAVIVLNKSSSSTPNDQWSRHRATEDFFKSMNPQIMKNKTFEGYVAKWAKSSVPITSMKELFDCYYSSIDVVRIPDKSRYQLLHDQRDVLREVILNCCGKSYNKKEKRKMLPDVDQFQLYLSLAFDHFSNSLDTPFDYVKASLQHRPPPENLADNVLLFAVLFGEQCHLDGKITKLFNKITNLVASCIMLDSIRKQRLGQPQVWFTTQYSTQDDAQEHKIGRSESKRSVSYKSVCMYVIKEYFETRVRCDFTLRRNMAVFERGFHCDLTWRTHDGIHRQREPFRTREEHGEFLSPASDDSMSNSSSDYYDSNARKSGVASRFSLQSYRWEDKVLQRLVDITKKVEEYNRTRQESSREIAISEHKSILQGFYKPLGETKFFCNSICLVCLFNLAQCTLICGHIICRECAFDYGHCDEGTQIIIDACPLGCVLGSYNEGPNMPILRSTIHIGPANSGLRILTLDGTGGLISLGFGYKQWTVAECIDKFQNLVHSAFTPRKAQTYSGIKYVERLIKKSKYETGPFAKALEEALGTSSLFGAQENGSRPLMVAVTATSASGTIPYILSSYNVRKVFQSASVKPTHGPSYTRHRPEKPEDELKVWEAARATSAAPGYFKPFGRKDELQFMDGAILHNNPIEIAMGEARNIAFAHNLCETPDILLSLGTGLQRDYKNNEDPPVKESRVLENAPKFFPKMPFINMLFTMVKYQIKLNLDSEIRWQKWSQQITDKEFKSRFYRINPDLGVTPPLLDDVNKVTLMLQNVTGWTQTDRDVQYMIGEIACRLVASSFYFEKRGNATKGPNSPILLKGVIQCRLPNNPQEMKAFGKFLGSGTKPASLVVLDPFNDDQNLPLPVQDMVNGHFTEVEVTISIPEEESQTQIALEIVGLIPDKHLFNISGFPRKLMRYDFASR
ncbi:hypothetical protein ACMFMG_001191 [Clarireedia jacksonii]